jgi:cellulose synthase/poly-beta-1,6-N-acetylglucosamine synthase-like glycosyltransferase
MNGFEITVLIVLTISMSVQLFFYLILFRIKNKKKNHDEKLSHLPVSVIIAARNASDQLKLNLPKILEQDYHEFEVIVTLDQTSDNSLQILETFASKYNNLKILNNPSLQKGKKAALTNSIKNSKYEYLLFTDADCCPISKDWIKLMAENFSDTKQIILGAGLYEKEPSILNSFIRYDSHIIAIQYSASAKVGRPYMGVGRNLAYTKSLWKKNSGFEKHSGMLSGDDDLFVIEASDTSNTAVCFESESITLSPAKNTISGFYKQKSRHISSSSKYNFVSKFLSGGELISRSIFFISVLAGLFTLLCPYILSAYIIRSVLVTLKVTQFGRNIKNPIPVFHIIIFDIFAPFFYGSLFIYKLLIYNDKEW